MKKENRITPDAMQMALGELAAQLGGLKEDIAALKAEVAELRNLKTDNVTNIERPFTRQEVVDIVLGLFENPSDLNELIKATGLDMFERIKDFLKKHFDERMNNHARLLNQQRKCILSVAESLVKTDVTVKTIEVDKASLHKSLQSVVEKMEAIERSQKCDGWQLLIRLLDKCFGGKNGWLRLFLTMLAVAFIILIALLIL